MSGLQGLFSKKKPTIVGLDISTTAVKLLELSRSGDRYRVENHMVEPLMADAVVEKDIKDVEAVGEAIKRVVKRSGTKAKFAAAAVSGSSVITKIISMDGSISEDDMEVQIELEADQYIPYPLEEVNIDFEVIGPSEKDPDRVDILLVAARTDDVDTRVDAIELGGLTPKVIDIEAYAIESCFSLLRDQIVDQGLDKTGAIIDIGATMTTLNVIHDLKTVYTREQNFGGKQLTDDIMRRFGLSYEEAGMAKRQGGLPDAYVPEVLTPFKRVLVQNVLRSLELLFSSTSYNSVDQIIMAGGSSAIEGVVEMVEEELGVPTLLANPFINMDIAPNVKPQRLGDDASSLLIAAGLALRSFD